MVEIKNTFFNKSCICLLTLFILFCGRPLFSQSVKSDKMLRVTGEGCFKFGDEDTPAAANKKALLIARRNAVENYKTFVSSLSKVKNYVLEEDVINSIAKGNLYNTRILKTSEKDRKICIGLEAFVKPDEIDKMMARSSTQFSNSKGQIVSGEWDVFSSDDSQSNFTQNSDRSIRWIYSVSKITDDTYAGLALETDPLSLKGQKLLIQLRSEKAFPLDILLFSNTPGYSDSNDDDTYVPVSITVPLKTGSQEILLVPSSLTIPDWWKDEKNVQKVEFTIEDVRKIEFEAVVDEDVGPVADTITVQNIFIQ